MTWTRFMDMHSGGSQKEPYAYIYIEAPEAEAKVIFYNRFGHNPDRVTCTCCGDDYSSDEEPTLALVSAYERGCNSLETPRDPKTRLYAKVDDPWFKAHYFLEPGEEQEARDRGWGISKSWKRESYLTVEEYVATSDVLVIRADEIKSDERSGEIPEQGYVWVD